MRILTFLVISIAIIFSCAHRVRAEFLCSIDFEYGLVVSETQIRFLQKSQTLQQINEQSDLFILGRQQSLTAEQQVLLQEYSATLHDIVPQMIMLATEGADIAIDAIDRVYKGFVGKDNESYERMRDTMQKTKMKIKDKFRHASGHYFIAPGSLESVDEFVDAELEAEMEDAISASVGGVLSAIGGVDDPATMVNEDPQGPTVSLKTKAQQFCSQLHLLDVLEEQLRSSSPQLDMLDVIVSQSTKTP